MSSLSKIQQIALAGILAIGAVGCDEPTRISNGRTFGPSVAMGDGTARSYLQLADGKPVEIGIELTEGVMQGLPSTGDHVQHTRVLEMPAQNPTPYQHLTLGWNPAGHEPPGIYDKPHFDFHFNTYSNVERIAIVPTDPAFEAKAARIPEASLLPAGYVSTGLAVPTMGVHWVDPTSPELRGLPFTRTFIYGTWDGRLVFGEPMITREYLLGKPNVRFAVPVPARAAEAGLYPSA